MKIAEAMAVSNGTPTGVVKRDNLRLLNRFNTHTHTHHTSRCTILFANGTNGSVDTSYESAGSVYANSGTEPVIHVGRHLSVLYLDATEFNALVTNNTIMPSRLAMAAAKREEEGKGEAVAS